MQTLKNHWKSLISDSEFSGRIDDLSRRLGKSPAYLRGLLNNQSIPGADVVLGLSDELGVSTDQLLMKTDAGPRNSTADKLADAITREIWPIVVRNLNSANDRPTGRDLMLWWHSNGGRLENYAHLAEYFDLYFEPPSIEQEIAAARLGAKSLASQSLGIGSPDLLSKTLAPLGTDFAVRVLKAHRNSIARGPTTTIEKLDVAHPDRDIQITVEYFRTLAPVKMPDGSTCILNFSELIG